MTDLLTDLRGCQCGTRSQLLVVDQNGVLYPISGGSYVIPNYGDHPTISADFDAAQYFTAVVNGSETVFEWTGPDISALIDTVDGITETVWAGNSSNTDGTIGGVRIIDGGTAGHDPIIVLALDSLNPPPFLINSDGKIETDETWFALNGATVQGGADPEVTAGGLKTQSGGHRGHTPTVAIAPAEDSPIPIGFTADGELSVGGCVSFASETVIADTAADLPDLIDLPPFTMQCAYDTAGDTHMWSVQIDAGVKVWREINL